MGVVRLSQDLESYAETRVLGSTGNATVSPRPTRKLIIDGPSFVYFVYHRLVSHTWPSVPTYADINHAVRLLLDDFQGHHLTVQHILFDGALPMSKRHVRLVRMEKLRQQLEAFRNAHPQLTASFTAPPADHRDIEHAVWRPKSLSTRRGSSSLPPPPFMVASAIEGLRSSSWSATVQVVPGEADPYCARAAADSDLVAGVLTNDSDLALYDLGPNGQVVLLHSLEKHDDAAGTSITASFLRLDFIKSRLGVPSLLRFGFERSLDGTASTAVIQRRAQDLDESDPRYMGFAALYAAADFSLDRVPSLHHLDPRTAEVWAPSSDPPHVYLTPLLEDPARDSSWSYGTEIRQLAYSLLLVNQGAPHHYVLEHTRKGRRIVAERIACLSRAQITTRLQDLLQRPGVHVDVNPTPSTTALLTWHVEAVTVIQRRKQKMGKPTVAVPQILHVLHLLPLTSSNFDVSWDDIHLWGNINAVLYSFRILKQILEGVFAHGASGQQTLDIFREDLKPLQSWLSTMPNIEELFLEIATVRYKISQLDVGSRNTTLAQLQKLAEVEAWETESSPKRAHHGHNDGEGARSRADTKTGTKRRRVSNATETPRFSNTFAVLPEE